MSAFLKTLCPFDNSREKCIPKGMTFGLTNVVGHQIIVCLNILAMCMTLDEFPYT